MRSLLPLLVALAPCALAQCPRGTLRSPVPSSNDYFGRRVSLSGDLALVSRYGDVGIGGPVEVFDLSTDEVLPIATLLAPGDPWTGWTHLLEGDRALLSGTDAVYLFDARTGVLRQTFRPDGPTFTFGYALAMDVQYVYVGSYDDLEVAGGLVYVFDPATGAVVKKLDSGLGLQLLRFGYSLEADGGRLLVGAFGHGPTVHGRAFLLDVASGSVLRTIDPPIPGEEQFGALVALEGDRALVTGLVDFDKQRTHLFDTTTGAEVMVAKSNGAIHDVELENGRAYLGATTSRQRVRVYDAATGTQQDTLYALDPSQMQFGKDLAVDGDRVLIGAPFFSADEQWMGSAYLFDICGEAGTSYCGPAVPNWTGLPGRLRAFGSEVVADGDLTLRADQLPMKRAAIGLVSDTQGFVMPPGADGNLCLAGAIGRYAAAESSPHGHLDLPLDLDALPTGQAVQPGETWNFQVWYRDIGDGSNFTDGLSVTFQ